MLFKDIKQNFPIYILDKSSVELIKGKVTATSFPHADSQNNQNNFNISNGSYGTVVPQLNQNNGQQRMVIDLTIEAGGRSAIYTVSENASINYAGNLVIATEQSLLASEVEAIKNSTEQALAPERLEQLKQSLEKSTALLSELNPTFKQQQEYDKRLGTMENSVNELKDMLTNFIKEFKS